MITSLGPENTVVAMLRELDLNVAVFAMYQYESSISRSTIERCLSFKREFTHDEAKSLLKLAHELREVQRSFPCKLDFRDVAGISAVMARRREEAAEEKSREERRQREAEIEVIEPY